MRKALVILVGLLLVLLLGWGVYSWSNSTGNTKEVTKRPGQSTTTTARSPVVQQPTQAVKSTTTPTTSAATVAPITQWGSVTSQFSSRTENLGPGVEGCANETNPVTYSPQVNRGISPGFNINVPPNWCLFPSASPSNLVPQRWYFFRKDRETGPWMNIANLCSYSCNDTAHAYNIKVSTRSTIGMLPWLLDKPRTTKSDVAYLDDWVKNDAEHFGYRLTKETWSPKGGADKTYVFDWYVRCTPPTSDAEAIKLKERYAKTSEQGKTLLRTYFTACLEEFGRVTTYLPYRNLLNAKSEDAPAMNRTVNVDGEPFTYIVDWEAGMDAKGQPVYWQPTGEKVYMAYKLGPRGLSRTIYELRTEGQKLVWLDCGVPIVANSYASVGINKPPQKSCSYASLFQNRSGDTKLFDQLSTNGQLDAKAKADYELVQNWDKERENYKKVIDSFTLVPPLTSPPNPDPTSPFQNPY